MQKLFKEKKSIIVYIEKKQLNELRIYAKSIDKTVSSLVRTQVKKVIRFKDIRQLESNKKDKLIEKESLIINVEKKDFELFQEKCYSEDNTPTNYIRYIIKYILQNR